eukprot:170673-Chlamydomonas_euryale.AAC.1
MHKDMRGHTDAPLSHLQAAAAALAARRAEEAMCIEDRIGHYVKRWMKEWGEDLESRPDEVKRTVQGAGAGPLPEAVDEGVGLGVWNPIGTELESNRVQRTPSGRCQKQGREQGTGPCFLA